MWVWYGPRVEGEGSRRGKGRGHVAVFTLKPLNRIFVKLMGVMYNLTKNQYYIQFLGIW